MVHPYPLTSIKSQTFQCFGRECPFPPRAHHEFNTVLSETANGKLNLNAMRGELYYQERKMRSKSRTK